MRSCLLFLTAVLVSTVAAPSRGQDAAAPADGASEPAAKHAGKVGLYLRPGTSARTGMRELFLTHPLLDAVVLNISWRDVEPRRGECSFEALAGEVQAWSAAGKGVVVGLALYGQAVDDQQTPPWIYDEPSVRKLEFAGGGTAKGRKIRIPVVWDPGFVEKHVDPMVGKFAAKFDGDPRVWYVMPGFGHIGNITCQPSKEGAAACLKAGWTPQAWQDYCRRVAAVYRRHFTRTPIFLKAAGMLIRDRRHDYYKETCGQILLEMANQGACVVHFGLESDRSEMQDVYQHIEPLLLAVESGRSRLGLGDDWPLWVPESRRGQGPTLGHDEEHLRRTLENAFVGRDGKTPLPTTVLFCQQPEILASHPKAEEYRPAVAGALRWARQKLKENGEKLSK